MKYALPLFIGTHSGFFRLSSYRVKKWYPITQNLFCFTLLAVVLSLLPEARPVRAQEAITYTPSDSSFTVDIPAGWTDTSMDAYGMFTRDDTTFYWLTFDAETLDDAVAQTADTLEIMLPEPVQVTPVPTTSAVWMQNLYIYDGGTLDAFIGTVSDGKAFVLFLRTTLEGAQAATSDVNAMLFSFKAQGALDLSAQTASPLTHTHIEAIDAYIADAVTSFDMPGVAVAIAQGGEIVYTGTFGVVSRETDTPVTNDTTFMIGSVTKSMTTMMVASIIDDGLLMWDTPVSEIAPDFALSDADVLAQLTVRDFFNMASGFPTFDIPLLLDYMSPREAVALMADVELIAPYREEFHYSNFMYAAGGYYVARLASGSDVDDWTAYTSEMQARVFNPIGMTTSEVDFDAALANPNHALPHIIDGKTGELAVLPLQWERFVESAYPAGAVWSNINDMGAYLLTQMGNGIAPNGTRVASAEALAETRTSQIKAEGLGAYGLGLVITNFYKHPELQHSGATTAFSSLMSFLPQSDLGIVVLTNCECGNLFSQAVRTYVYETAFGLPHERDEVFAMQNQQYRDITLQQRSLLSQTPVPAEDLADFMGRYAHGISLIDEDGVATLTGDFGHMPVMQSSAEMGESTYLVALSYITLRINFTDTALMVSVPGDLDTYTVERIE